MNRTTVSVSEPRDELRVVDVVPGDAVPVWAGYCCLARGKESDARTERRDDAMD